MILLSYQNFYLTGNKVLQNDLYNLIFTPEQEVSHRQCLMQGKPTLLNFLFVFLQLNVECALKMLGKIRLPGNLMHSVHNELKISGEVGLF